MISKTPVVSSGDVNVKVASHLSNLPAMLIDAFTSNLIELCSGVISNTGACPRVTDGSAAKATRLRTANRMEFFTNMNLPDKYSVVRWVPHPTVTIYRPSHSVENR